MICFSEPSQFLGNIHMYVHPLVQQPTVVGQAGVIPAL